MITAPRTSHRFGVDVSYLAREAMVCGQHGRLITMLDTDMLICEYLSWLLFQRSSAMKTLLAFPSPVPLVLSNHFITPRGGRQSAAMPERAFSSLCSVTMTCRITIDIFYLTNSMLEYILLLEPRKASLFLASCRAVRILMKNCRKKITAVRRRP